MSPPALLESNAPVSVEQARTFTERVQRDPLWFHREVLGCAPYDKQISIAESVRDNYQTSVVGANGTGKDYETGRLVCWWQSSRFPAKTLILGPTHRQVADIVWREVRDAYRNARTTLGGRMAPTESRWDGSERHFALGFSTDKPYNVLGFHGPNLLVIVTEAHNLGNAYFEQIKRLQPERILYTGNPFSASGEFYDSHHAKRDLYSAIQITAFDSPNVKNNNHDVPGLVTREDIDRYARDWGVGSDLYEATVNAKFVSGPDGIYPLAWLLAARAKAPLFDPVKGKVSAGLDVAGPGEDETVLTLRQGNAVLSQHAWLEEDPRGKVVAILNVFRPFLDVVNIDSIGIGWGIYLHLRDLKFPVVPINVSVTDGVNTELYANMKSQMYWGFRQRLQDLDVIGISDESTIAQLAGLKYDHNARGQIVIESKDESRKRGTPSPDRAESLILSFLSPRRRRRPRVGSG